MTYFIFIQCSITFQNVSCYGLLDLNTILSPPTTGQYLEVAYYPGYQYVAYRAEDPQQVASYKINQHISKGI